MDGNIIVCISRKLVAGMRVEFIKMGIYSAIWILLNLVGFSKVVAHFNSPSSNLNSINSNPILTSEPYRHRVSLDSSEKYLLEWEINWEKKLITFNVTVGTKGYVGFGLSRKGKMSRADLVIGGVQDGQSYFSDHHAIGNQLPEIDKSQDWILHSAWERENQTFLSFSRAFETCDDEHDLQITDDLLTLIWAYGERDSDITDIDYHFQNRDFYDVYLLDPNFIPRPARTLNGNNIDVINLRNDIKVHRLKATMTLPAEETLYWCTIHKSPPTTKHHIIGYNTVFPPGEEWELVHHVVIYRCFAPPGQNPDDFFKSSVNGNGSACYTPGFPNVNPTAYCNEMLHLSAVGSQPFFFPEHVGIPMSETGSEYFLMQTHYDNPSERPGRLVSSALEIYYTANLREHDLSGMPIGYFTQAARSIIIPPSSQSHVIVGHCAGECTKKMFPEEGISIVGAILHTHVAGRGVRLLHFRGNEELPWIIADDNYGFDQQYNRMLNDERRSLPGDMLTARCVYDSTNRNGSTLVGGFATSQEMCLALVWYYNRLPGYWDCRGEIKSEEYGNFIGIHNTTMNEEGKEVVITEPQSLAGILVKDYVNNNIEWDIEKREDLQRQHLYQPFTSTCTNYLILGMNEWDPNSDDFPAPIFNTTTDSHHDSVLPRGIPRYKRRQTCPR